MTLESQRTKTSAPILGLRHAVGREWYLLGVDLNLDGRVPGRHRKRILADLRDCIDTEAETTSLKAVLAGLGKPDVLAKSYVEGADHSRPLWSGGLIAAAGVLAIYSLFFFTYLFGMLAVVSQVGGEFHSHFLFVNVMAFSDDTGIGIGWFDAAALWVPATLAFLAFALGSRSWRVFRR
ncbi:hypothetical protein [Arthrobacter psychrolactophilus]